MAEKRLTRRTLLKAGASAAAFAATTNIFTPLKTFAARQQKLVFWMQPLFNPKADEIMLGQVRDYAKQVGLKESELEIQTVPGGEVAKKMAAALEVGAPPDVTRMNEEDLTRLIAQKQFLPITEIVEQMRKVPGGVNENIVSLAEDGGKYYGAPFGLNPQAGHARRTSSRRPATRSFRTPGRSSSRPPRRSRGRRCMPTVWPWGSHPRTA